MGVSLPFSCRSESHHCGHGERKGGDSLSMVPVETIARDSSAYVTFMPG